MPIDQGLWWLNGFEFKCFLFDFSEKKMAIDFQQKVVIYLQRGDLMIYNDLLLIKWWFE